MTSREPRRPRSLSAPAFSADAVTWYMGSVNPVFQGMGMVVRAVSPGYALMAMVTRSDMGNTYGVCHGGIVFSLADMCFGMAANSRDVRAVTASAEIHYIAPTPIGIEVVAEGKETWRGPRSGLYDIEVRDTAGEVFALMRARARIMDERVIPEDVTLPDHLG